VAAPTAGLHFDRDLLDVLADLGVRHTHITLHVGAGTFQPVRTERVESHSMHTESVRIGPDTAQAILRTRRAGGRIVAVGTTSLRALETVAADPPFGPWEGESSIFIYPGFQFRVVDLLISNFHLPGSSLMMLVTAFGGYRRVMDAYREAVRRDYRFFSYGDAMLLDRGASEDLPPSVGEP
jgi:S-adenosylmethionine:tRNA ribosyltransferase-isomerase